MHRGFVGLIVGLLTLSLMGCSVFELMSDPANTKRIKIVGSAMEPNFHDGQIVEIEEVPVTDLQRGDVILLTVDEERQYLKRLIGLPGETLEIIDGKVYIDGKVLEEPYLQETSEVNRFPTPPITLKPNEYYVLGDNRNNSSDSRGFGPISGENIRGRVKQ
jgi:signal peptidase I